MTRASSYLPPVPESPALRLTKAQRERAPEYRARLEERLAQAMPAYFTARMREQLGLAPESPALKHRAGNVKLNGEPR